MPDDQDKDAFETGEPNELMPGEEGFEEDFEEEFEAEEEAREEEARAEAQPEVIKHERRFRFGRGEEQAGLPLGSVRETHERVRVDDRISGIFALLCALGLVGILVGGFLSQYMPAPAPKPLPTLNLETFKVSPSVTVSGSPSASASVAPSASPTAAPSAS